MVCKNLNDPLIQFFVGADKFIDRLAHLPLGDRRLLIATPPLEMLGQRVQFGNIAADIRPDEPG